VCESVLDAINEGDKTGKVLSYNMTQVAPNHFSLHFTAEESKCGLYAGQLCSKARDDNKKWHEDSTMKHTIATVAIKNATSSYLSSSYTELELLLKGQDNL